MKDKPPIEPLDVGNVSDPADMWRWDQLNVNLKLIADEFARINARIDALAMEVEKLRAAVGVGDDESTSKGVSEGHEGHR